MKINVILTRNHTSLFSESATSLFSENDAYLFSGNIRTINQNHTGSFVEYAQNVITGLKEEKRYGTATAYSDALKFLVNYSEKKDISFME